MVPDVKREPMPSEIESIGPSRSRSVSRSEQWRNTGAMYPRLAESVSEIALSRRGPSLLSSLSWYPARAVAELNLRLGSPFGRAPNPSTIFIVINNKCNLFCRMCDVGRANRSHQRPGETDATFSRNLMTRDQLDLEVWKRLVDDVAHFKPLIAVTSTEPLLYGQLLDLIDHCHSKGLRVQVTTNGFLLEKFVGSFLEKRLDVLAVSIDGPPEVHNRIRGVGGAFEKAVGAVNQIMSQRRGTTPRLEINYTICDLNFDKLIETLGLVNCDRLTFSHLNFVTEEMASAHNTRCRYAVTPSGLSEVRLEAIDLDVLWAQIQEVKKTKTAFQVTFVPELSRDELDTFYRTPLQFLRNHSECRAIWTIGQVLADGSLTGSTRCFDTARLGNIRDNPFSTLWNGSIFLDFRKYLRKSKGAYPACARCCGLL